MAIRVDLYEVCFPLTNCYFPCLRSNGCGGITLQLKTTKSLFTRTSFSTPVLPCSNTNCAGQCKEELQCNFVKCNAGWQVTVHKHKHAQTHAHSVCHTQTQTYTHACTHMFSAFLSNYLTATEGWARMITVINCNWI